MKVLVVDDSAAIRTRLVALMRDVAGIEPVEAAGAEEALAYLRVHRADFVVLDLHMPGKSGLQVLPDIRASASSPVVIVLTSHPTEHHRRLCLAQGADFFFDKSREFARVLEIIGRPTPTAGPSYELERRSPTRQSGSD